ncbi:iron-containing alcohol dehydrogenase [Paenibacillus turpanensis]|uniref:iron-containing alcohol dehydrogenase n=1 Tax=Paenibacillus turpanensis TaxID=2689078 RepID=UPI00140DA647|nr:iron-containing alcohol dehydrogenase [Paenibacillus turpanensis]
MNTFVYYNPTRLYFGSGSLEQLTNLVPQYGTNVLVVYGGGSIKKNGVYDRVIQQLAGVNAKVHELSGVEPNPRLSTVNKGIDICKKENIELILAVGGGSVIDCTKAIAIGAKYEGNVWDIITRKATGNAALPFGTVLTLAATGSEMNSGSVITNWETQEKLGWGSPLVFPKFSILDPEFTFSVPKDQTVYGMVDIMSHVLEQYFNHTGNTPVQDGFCETILRTVIAAAPKLLDNLQSYEHRETILYSGTMALNGTLAMGVRGDWATHNIEHAVSAVYDIPHGGGLAILFPNWMGHVLDEGVTRFKQFAVNVFDIDPAGKSDRETALEGIQALRSFWSSIGAPSRLADYGITDEKLEIMADKTMVYGPFGHFKTLQREDVLEIYRKSL